MHENRKIRPNLKKSFFSYLLISSCISVIKSDEKSWEIPRTYFPTTLKFINIFFLHWELLHNFNKLFFGDFYGKFLFDSFLMHLICGKIYRVTIKFTLFRIWYLVVVLLISKWCFYKTYNNYYNKFYQKNLLIYYSSLKIYNIFNVIQCSHWIQS